MNCFKEANFNVFKMSKDIQADIIFPSSTCEKSIIDQSVFVPTFVTKVTDYFCSG